MIPRILIADVKTEIRELFTRVLEEDGSVSCYACGDTQGLFHQIEEISFSLILLDVRMVFSKGFLLLKAIKRTCPDTAMVVMGCLKELDVMKRAMEAGACGYILKPVTGRNLRTAVREFLVRHGVKKDDPGGEDRLLGTKIIKSQEVVTVDPSAFLRSGAG